MSKSTPNSRMPRAASGVFALLCGLLAVNGCSAASRALNCPGAPTAIVATPGDSQVQLSWAAPEHMGTSPISAYTVTTYPGGMKIVASEPKVVVTGLTNGRTYAFTVHATNDSGDGPESAPSAAVSPAVSCAVPAAPTIVSVSAGNGQATITWLPPESTGGTPITGYTVTADQDDIAATTTSETQVTVTGLTNGTSYSFTVHATNANGDSPESMASEAVIPVTSPGAPTSVVAVAGEASVQVSWSAPANSSELTEYTVISVPSGPVITALGQTSVNVGGLTNGSRYRFLVIAANEAGSGTPSELSNAVTPMAVPDALCTGAGAASKSIVPTVGWKKPSARRSALWQRRSVSPEATGSRLPGGRQS